MRLIFEIGIPIMVALLLVTLLVTGIVSAPFSPMPVSMKVINVGSLAGYQIQQTNLRTSETVTLITDGNGFVLYDWSNSVFKWVPGDTIRTVVVECSSSSCTVDNKIDIEGSPIYFTLDITGKACPNCPTCSCHCKDCPSCSCPSCPDCSVVTCPDQIVCETCPTCPVEKVCPECETCEIPTGWEFLLGVIGAIFGVSGSSLAIYYRNKTTGKYKKVTETRLKDGTVKKEAG